MLIQDTQCSCGHSQAEEAESLACPIPVPFSGSFMSGLEDTKFHYGVVRLRGDSAQYCLEGGNCKLSCRA